MLTIIYKYNHKKQHMQVMTRHDIFWFRLGSGLLSGFVGRWKRSLGRGGFLVFGKFRFSVYCFDYCTFLELVGYLDIGRMDRIG